MWGGKKTSWDGAAKKIFTSDAVASMYMFPSDPIQPKYSQYLPMTHSWLRLDFEFVGFGYLYHHIPSHLMIHFLFCIELEPVSKPTIKHFNVWFDSLLLLAKHDGCACKHWVGLKPSTIGRSRKASGYLLTTITSVSSMSLLKRQKIILMKQHLVMLTFVFANN